MNDDHRSYRELTAAERDTFNFLMGLLSALDTPQSRIIFEAASFVTDPAARSILIFIAQQEVIHNQSYSYVLSSLVSREEQNRIFDRARLDEDLHKRNESIYDDYNAFLDEPSVENLARMLISALALEGVHFYGAFAYFYNLARQNKMVGTSTIVSYINKDELVHTKFVVELLHVIMNEYPELAKMIEEYAHNMLKHAALGELALMRNHVMKLPGLNWEEFTGYVQYRANKLMNMLGFREIFPGVSENNMPWIRAYVDNFDGVKTDFFEQKVRQYSKITEDDGLGDI